MNPTLSALPLLLLAVPASAQTALLREGDFAPDQSGRFIVGLATTSVNHSGGFAATIAVTDNTSSQSQIWGNLTGGPGAVIREEGTFGSLVQNQIDGTFGISSSTTVYTTFTNSIDDAVWVDDSLLAITGTTIPGSNETYTFIRAPRVTESGTPYFISSIGNSSTGGNGLFVGTTPATILRTGDMVPGLPVPLGSSGIDSDYQISAQGTHYIAPVDLDTGSFTNDEAMVIDGAGLMIGGMPVQELNPVAVSAGGIGGETWDNFDFCGITEAGDYAITGNTDGPNNTDEFIVRNGVIWAREGDTLDGQILAGSIEGAYLNEANRLAFIWDIEVGGVDIEALFLDDQLILAEGDEVDWDGNGQPDPGVTLLDFTGTRSLSLSDDGDIYFTADVRVGTATLEGYFVVAEGPAGINYCVANVNSTGSAASISSSGSPSLTSNDLILTSSNMPTFSFGFFITSQTQGFVMNPGGSEGNLCVAGMIGRGVGGGAANTGASGSLTVNVDFTNLPQPNGAVSAMVGDTWNFQCWMRDATPGGMATSNFSDGFSVTVQ